jgi:hypothetical protein
MLAAYSSSHQDNWDMYLPLVLFAYRTTVQSTTGYSPFEGLYGREPRLGNLDNYNLGYEPSEFVKNLHERWQDAKERIMKQAEINKEIYDNKYEKEPPKYQVGEEVRVKQPLTRVGLKAKLRNDHWSQPMEIQKVLSKQNIAIKLPNGKTKVVNVNNVKKREKARNFSEAIPGQATTRYGRKTQPRIT